MFLKEYPMKLKWVDFGGQLICTDDLDPVYVMLSQSNLPTSVLSKWLVAYWCFYHSGVASRIAESKDFYNEMYTACEEKWPRAAERRHFRGDNALRGIASLKLHGTPERLVEKLCAPPYTFESLATRIGEWEQFGPWITFKIADMLERILEIPIKFNHEETTCVYKEPVAGARLIATIEGWETTNMPYVFSRIQKALPSYMAPPLYDRLINLQEIETICCKFKAHLNGRYPVGKDSRELKHSLVGWGDLATTLQREVPDPDILERTPPI